MALEKLQSDIFEITPSLTPNNVVSGTLFVENVPASKRFMVIDRLSGNILASGKSNKDGKFKRFVGSEYFNNKKLFVISFDDTATYNAEVADHINAVP